MIELDAYVGRTETARDTADAERIRLLAATLDHGGQPWKAGMLPPLGHWLCFRPDAPQSALGADGHPARSDTSFLPNVDLPRRMWAGSRVRFLNDIPLGAAMTRTSTIRSAVHKQGRSGAMVFVTVEHSIAAGDGGPAIVEEQDIVYRDAPTPGAPLPRGEEADIAADAAVRRIAPDSVLLFRYSALTFNAHRIHYDRDYTVREEGYPGLVVQGPLLATLLMDHHLREHGPDRIGGFEFRAMSPLIEGDAIDLVAAHGDGETRLQAIGPRGLAMAAKVTLR
ncbi:FAS1-like dehydratase domain-containing protein [Rhizorhabdus dicambivorans]|uniref:Acyl-CoA dehydrogenase n=1 Tax=Rhizorhabdus dicambivorans TaxID=1850238 RepID=A0A2A4FX75_9SPHN|nr:MaoC family dehydratase N-terminal domain-containing protein [Rhizorhabdus dicambivorans]ATE63680.1 acyl-CoA dehydrogenase [Rhizorhabdus dicambivorans]PCE42808.1 acyl-CoA dehydrogenase [Rhizorhabdus dicambivorans]